MNDVQQGVWYFGIWLMVGEAGMELQNQIWMFDHMIN